jgi:hypothetical protein
LICSAVWGLFSLIALIAWLRWQGDHSSACDVPTAALLGLLPHTQAVKKRVRYRPPLPGASLLRQ